MHSYLAIVFLLLSSVSGFAYTDPQPHRSPDGRHVIYNIGDTAAPEHYFEIRAKDGTVLLSTQEWLSTHANQIMWSSGGRFALISFDEGKLRATCVYSFDERKVVSLSHVIDGWTVPVRWVNSRTFIVENSGPHGGKARGDYYHNRETYRIRTLPFSLDRVYVGPTITTKDDSDIP